AGRGRDARANPGRLGQEHPPAGARRPGSSSGEGRVVTAATGQAVAPPVTRQRGFWVLMGYAVVLGGFGAFAALIFVGAVTFRGKWYSDSHPGWFGGRWGWVAGGPGGG